jgi:dinuclear metal center YbgI/SA1388 family protein
MPNPTLAEVLVAVEALWPLAGAEEWDEPGLVVGQPSQEISRIHLVVDATPENVGEALEQGADLIIAHHPLLLRGVTTVAETTYKGAVVSMLIRGNAALYSAHTNADVVPTGTSARLAELLGLTNHLPLEPGLTPGHGIGRVGDLNEPISLYELSVRLGDIIPHTAVGPVVAGDPTRQVSRVSLCAGAGDSLIHHPEVAGSDVFITSEMRHLPASEFVEHSKITGGPSLINISHFAAEWVWLDQAASELSAALDVSIHVSDWATDPWDFQVQRVGEEG